MELSFSHRRQSCALSLQWYVYFYHRCSNYMMHRPYHLSETTLFSLYSGSRWNHHFVFSPFQYWLNQISLSLSFRFYFFFFSSSFFPVQLRRLKSLHYEHEIVFRENVIAWFQPRCLDRFVLSPVCRHWCDLSLSTWSNNHGNSKRSVACRVQNFFFAFQFYVVIMHVTGARVGDSRGQ